MASLDTNRGAKRAREAREALGLDPAAPLACLLDVVEARAGRSVIVAALPDGIAGACYRGLLWVNGREAAVRKRFTLAHEFGHAWCKHDGRLEPDTVATLSGRTTNPYEIQANAFAAEFLVPRAGLQPRLDDEPTLEDVVGLAAEFGVSAIVVVYRLKTLRLVTDARIARLQRELEEGMHARWLDVPEAVDDRLGRLDALPYLSPALGGTLLEAALRGDAAVGHDLAAAIERLLVTRPAPR